MSLFPSVFPRNAAPVTAVPSIGIRTKPRELTSATIICCQPPTVALRATGRQPTPRFPTSSPARMRQNQSGDAGTRAIQYVAASSTLMVSHDDSIHHERLAVGPTSDAKMPGPQKAKIVMAARSTPIPAAKTNSLVPTPADAQLLPLDRCSRF